jgi:hypothetical protein
MAERARLVRARLRGRARIAAERLRLRVRGAAAVKEAVRRHPIVVVVCMLLVPLVALVIAVEYPPPKEATGTIIFTDSSFEIGYFGSEPLVLSARAAGFREAELKLRVARVGPTTVVDAEASADDPYVATDRVNRYLEAVTPWRQGAVVGRLRAALRLLRQRAAALAGSDLQAVREDIRTVRALLASAPGKPTGITPAEPPTGEDERSRLLLAALLGLLFGLFLGLGLATIFDLMESQAERRRALPGSSV